jgi:hypothetical protein
MQNWCCSALSMPMGEMGWTNCRCTIVKSRTGYLHCSLGASDTADTCNGKRALYSHRNGTGALHAEGGPDSSLGLPHLPAASPTCANVGFCTGLQRTLPNKCPPPREGGGGEDEEVMQSCGVGVA